MSTVTMTPPVPHEEPYHARQQPQTRTAPLRPSSRPATRRAERPIRSGSRQRAFVGGGEAGEREGADQQAEVPQGDVVVLAEDDEIEDDPCQPGGDEVAADLRPDGDDEAGDDLD